MSRRGTSNPPEAYVQLIRDNLNDRYGRGFPIIKELVQNADDAGATRLDIGIVPGISGCDHPLLRDPALIVVNDGGFTEANARALHQLGMSNRGAEDGTIGKFGLGLKSIFHLCEAFFYSASIQEVMPGEMARPWTGGLYCPWLSDDPAHKTWHPEWDRDLTDVDLAGIGSSILDLDPVPGRRWFCIRAPLRRAAHCPKNDQNVPVQIVSFRPGDGLVTPVQIFGNDPGNDLAALMPMLRNLSSIRLWWTHLPDGIPEIHLEVSLKAGSQRRRDWDVVRADVGKELPLAGSVVIDCTPQSDTGPTASTAPFAGAEILLDTTESRSLQEDPDWPVQSVDLATGKADQRREKGLPHCAVYISRLPTTRGGCLSIAEAAFLPLGDPVRFACRSKWDFRLTLHGYFFIDAGRREVDRGDVAAAPDVGRDRRIRWEWNRHLEEAGIDPLILPALARFARIPDQSLTDEQIRELTSSLAEWAESGNRRASICSKQQWLYRLDNGTGKWCLMPANQKIHEVPLPQDDRPETAFKIIRGLAAVSQRLVVVPSAGRAESEGGWPRLCATDAVETWSDGDVRQLLRPGTNGVDVDQAFEKASHLGYLIDLVKGLRVRPDSQVKQECAVALAREALERKDLGKLRRPDLGFRQFVSLIGADRRFPLALGALPKAEQLLCKIFRLRLEVLALPTDLDSEDDRGSAKLREQDARSLLEALCDARFAPDPSRYDDSRSAVAIDVIASLADPAAAPSVCQEPSELQPFWAWNCRTREPEAYSWAKVAELKKQSTLFARAPGKAPPELAIHLQQALAVGDVVLAQPGLGRILPGSQLLPELDRKSCVRLLNLPVQLAGEPANRADLLSALAASLTDGSILQTDRKELVSACRYLLHASREHIGSREVLLACPSGPHSEVWIRLAEQALALSGSGWRLVSHELARRVSQHSWDDLQLKLLDTRAIEKLLKDCDPARIDGSKFSDKDLAVIILGIQDDDLLRSLPIHRTVDGRLVRIEPGRAFLPPEDIKMGGTEGLNIDILQPYPELQQKQRRLTQALDAERLIRRWLDFESPHKYCQNILSILEKALNGGAMGDPDWASAIQERPWLVGAGNNPVAPNKVIHLPGLESELAAILPAGSDWTPTRALHEQVREHAAFQSLAEKVLPPVKTTLENLGRALAKDEGEDAPKKFECKDEHERWYLGSLPDKDFDLDLLLKVLANVPEDLLPIVAFLKKLRDGFPDGAAATALHLLKPISGARIIRILAHLVEGWERSGAERKDVERVHGWYLAAARQHPEFHLILKKIKLLNSIKGGITRKWEDPRKLCVSSTGSIAPGNVLDAAQAEILSGVLPKNETEGQTGNTEPGSKAFPSGVEEWERAFSAGAAELGRMLAEWEAVLMDRQELIGGFLALLGDQPDIAALARRYLGNRSLEATRNDLFGWQPEEVAAIGVNETITEVMTRQRFLLDFRSGETTEVLNLLGERFQARLAENPRNLLVDPTPEQVAYQTRLNFNIDKLPWRVKILSLRRLDIRGRSPEQLSQLLLETSRSILGDPYRREMPEKAWEVLQTSDQLSIEIAKHLLLESAFLNFRYLGLRGSPCIGPLLARWDEAQRSKVEAEQNQVLSGSGGNSRSDPEERWRQAIRQLRLELENLLTSDAAAEGDVLSAVRKRMLDYQYTIESVPFELFQNADDAVVEWDELRGSVEPVREGERRFVVHIDGQTLAFCHWGRPVNHFACGAVEARDRGFDRDLEKMLLLNYSDKGTQRSVDPKVTGKFGLGFKSTFLVCDRPRMVSGRLAFEVIAGMFPSRLASTGDIERLRNLLGRVGPAEDEDGRIGTCLELSLSARVKPFPEPDRIMGRFEALLPYLLVFARRIRHCAILRNDREPLSHTWSGRQLGSAPLTQTGWVRAGRGGQAAVRLLLWGGASGSVLAECGPSGLVALPADVPTIWVTAPTQEAVDIGFALNGQFDLDVGRVRLSGNSDANRERARALGRQLGSALCELFRASAGEWESVRKDLELREHVQLYDFWESVWKLLTESLALRSKEIETSPAFRLAYLVVWGSVDCGCSRLYRECAALPTGLPAGDYRTLVRMTEVKFVTRGRLESPDCISRVSRWPGFRRNWAPGSIIAGHRWDQLAELAGIPAATHDVDLADALRLELRDDPEVGPDRAADFGEVVNSSLILELRQALKRRPEERSRAREEEWPRLSEALKTARFRCLDGEFRAADDLLLPDRDPDARSDEHLRAAFAPDNRVLHPDYQASPRARQAIDFFKACRGEVKAREDALAEWIFGAMDEKRQVAALRYILIGDLGKGVLKVLRADGRRTWLADLRHSPLSRHFTRGEWTRLLEGLGLVEVESASPIPFPGEWDSPDDEDEGEDEAGTGANGSVPNWEDNTSKPARDRRPDRVRERLEAIYRWWTEEGGRDIHLARHDGEVFPDGQAPSLNGVDPEDGEEGRRRWLVLLGLGACQTTGRQSPGQFRSFIHLCMNGEHSPVFAGEEFDAARWFDVIDRFLDTQAEHVEHFFLLRRHFVAFYQIARWLPAYAESFRQAFRFDRPFPIDAVISPRSAGLQGSDLDAPSLRDTVGPGACFVLRELCRQGFGDRPGLSGTFRPVYEHCYMPSRRVRTLLGQLGCEGLDNNAEPAGSRIIFEFLKSNLGEERATFGGTFDIPFRVIGYDRELWNRFVGSGFAGNAGN